MTGTSAAVNRCRAAVWSRKQASRERLVSLQYMLEAYLRSLRPNQCQVRRCISPFLLKPAPHVHLYVCRCRAALRCSFESPLSGSNSAITVTPWADLTATLELREACSASPCGCAPPMDTFCDLAGKISDYAASPVSGMWGRCCKIRDP